MASFQSAYSSPDDVVISGISGIFPKSDNMNELEHNLMNNIDFLEEVQDPYGYRERLGVPCHRGTIRDKDKFDTTFFGISQAQTFRMDSITWRILEKTYEAILDSGHNPSDLRNSNTAVIIGSFVSESEALWLEHGQSEAGFSVIGHNRCMLANRVSYWLSTKGSSYAVYAEELAGVSCLTQAYELITTHQCDGAIIGTVDITSRPELVYGYRGLISPLCSQLDSSRIEYIRSDACVVMYLQRARDAKRIYASVAHSDCTYHGNRNAGIARPLKQPLSEFLHKFYDKCPVDFEEINYLEASSIGIKVYEEVELEVVKEFILDKKKLPLLAGSAKCNMGSTMSSSSLSSIAKILIAMKTEVIPANTQYKSTVPHSTLLTEGKLQVVSENTSWEPKYSAVNGMDVLGNCGHVLLRANNKRKSPNSNCDDELPRLICFSGRNEEKMEKTLQEISSMPLDVEFVRLLQDVHSANMNHNYRSYVVTPSANNNMEIQHFDGSNRPVWFVFSGMGSQWSGMATHLMKLPIIAQTIQECHRILEPKGVDLIEIVTSDNPEVFKNILHSFVGIAAIQLALVEMLRLLNIEPDGIIGHSVGELGCAYADGCFTKEQMILAAYYRGLASIESELIDGRMAAVGLGYSKVKSMLPSTVDVACHNSKDSSTISGPADDVNQFVAELKAKNIFAREVNVSNIAYHSRYIQPAAPKLLSYLKKIIVDAKPRSSRWYSTSAPEELWNTEEARYSSAEYHTNNLLNSVLFEETSKHIPKNAILVEIAPHGLLQAILRRSMPPETVNIPLTQRDNSDGLEFLLSAIGKFYLTGKVPRVSALYPPVEFPVSAGTPSISSLVTWDHTKIWRTPENINLNETRSIKNTFKIRLNEGQYSLLREYKVNGELIFPLSAVLVLVWKAIGSSRTRYFQRTPVTFQNVVVARHLTIPENESITLILSCRHGSGSFEVYVKGSDDIYFKGVIKRAEDVAKSFSPESPPAREEYEELTAEEFYQDLSSRGYELGEKLRKVRKVITNDTGSKASIEYSSDWMLFVDSLLQLAIMHANEGKQTLQLPSFIQKVVINPLENISVNECEAVFNKFTASVRCGPVELTGIQTKGVEKRSNVASYTVNFLPYVNVQYKSSSEFIDNVVQLLLENVGSLGVKSVVLTELVDGPAGNNVGSEVRDAISSCYRDKVVVDTISVSDIHNSMAAAALVASDLTVRQALDMLKKSGGLLLARLKWSTKLDVDESLVVVAEHCSQDTRWIVLKKLVPVNITTPVVYLPQIHYWEHPGNQVDVDTSKYYLVAEAESLAEVKEYLNYVAQDKLHDVSSCRFVFLLDSEFPPFSLNSEFYSEQLSLDFAVNIYYNGTWGCLRNFETSPTTACGILSRLEAAIRGHECEWKCVSINLKNFCRGDKGANDVLVVDVAGYNMSDQKVMCMAQIKSDSSQLTVSPHFTWQVPNSWNLQDAATVPFAYYLAYYSLVVRVPYFIKGTSILVHAGHTYLGQAYIAVALQIGLHVSATVPSEKHRLYLKSKFPQLEEHNIRDWRERNLALNLLQMRQYVGFDIIINLLQEPFLQMSVSVVNLCGCILQLCTTEMEQKKDFGMAPFLMNLSLISIIPEVIFELSTTIKKLLHERVTQGIKAGVVKPFDKLLCSFEQEDTIFRSLSDLEFTSKVVITEDKCRRRDINSLKEGKNIVNMFSIDMKKSYLIVGDKPEDCLVMAEWLVHRGCTSLIICCEEHNMLNITRRQLRLLRTYHRVHVRIFSSERQQVLHDALCPTNGVNNGTALAAVFVLPVKDPLLAQLLEVAVSGIKTVSRFVQLISNNTGCSVANARRKRGLSVLDVQWDNRHKTIDLRNVVGQLDKLLEGLPNETLFLADQENAKTKTNELSSLAEQVSLFLPPSVEELEDMGDELMSCKTCTLQELCTNTPRTSHVREIHPVFIFPGIQGPARSCAEMLAHQLHCPAVLVDVPAASHDIQHNIATITQDVLRVQQGGIYNIVGISWGGIYAIELARHLQSIGERTHVILVDGAPHRNQMMVRHLGEESQLQVNILTALLNFSSKKMSKSLLELPDWSSRVLRALDELKEMTPSSKSKLTVAIECVYSRINTLMSYCPGEALLSGDLTLILSNVNKNDDCKLEKVFKNKATVSFVDCNHREVLENAEVAFIISDSVSADVYWNKN